MLALPGYRGVLAYTLAEALWLADTGDEHVVVGYPSGGPRGRRRAGRHAELASRVTLMVDSTEQLDSHRRGGRAGPARDHPGLPRARRFVATSPLLGHIGVRRSPVHTACRRRARSPPTIVRAARVPAGRHDGLRGADRRHRRPPGGPPGRGAVIRWMQRRRCPSSSSVAAAAVAAVREHRRPRVRQRRRHRIARVDAARTVGHRDRRRLSGLFGPHLFDGYAQFRPRPPRRSRSAVVRKPRPAIATMLGGGWIASGPPGSRPAAADRLAARDSRMVPREAAGEVQTPVTGRRRARPASRRPGLVPPHQSRRTVRAPRRVCRWSTATPSSAPCPPTAAKGRCSCDGAATLGPLAQLGPHARGSARSWSQPAP